jgi:hypothetical protein
MRNLLLQCKKIAEAKDSLLWSLVTVTSPIHPSMHFPTHRLQGRLYGYHPSLVQPFSQSITCNEGKYITGNTSHKCTHIVARCELLYVTVAGLHAFLHTAENKFELTIIKPLSIESAYGEGMAHMIVALRRNTKALPNLFGMCMF